MTPRWLLAAPIAALLMSLPRVASAEDSPPAAPDSAVAASPDTAIVATPPRVTSALSDSAHRSVRDTVTVLPTLHVDSDREKLRHTDTRVTLRRANVVRFLPASTGDALLQAPGVELIKTGPWASQISLRGLSGDRVLLLVDGVRLNTARGHGGQASLVPLSRLDAVEIVPGATSTEYGSDALGGVVNLITHRSLFSASPAADLTLAARAAEPGVSRDENARLRLTTPHIGAEISGGLGHFHQLVTPDGPLPNSGDHERDMAARVGARISAFTLDLEHTHYAALDVGLPAFSNGGSSASYPLQQRDADRFELTAPASGWRPELRLLTVLQTYRTYFTENTLDSVFLRGRLVATRYNTAADRVRNHSWNLQPSLRFERLWGLQLTSETRRERTRGPRFSELTVRDAGGAMTSYSAGSGVSVAPAYRHAYSGTASFAPPIKWFRLETGARYDAIRARADGDSAPIFDHDAKRWSGEVGAARAFRSIEPYAHLGSGFRVPNLDELGFDDEVHGGFRLFGNPELVPEHSVTYEAGVRTAGTLDGWLRSARLSAYRSDVEDMITVRYVGAVFLVPRFQYFNVHRARVQGYELTGEVAIRKVKVSVNGALPRGIDRDTGKPLLDAGRGRVNADVSIPVPHLPRATLGVQSTWINAITGVDPNYVRPAQWTGAVEAAAVFFDTRFTVAVKNLLNASYREPLSFIPEPKRTVAFSIQRGFDIPLPAPGERR